MSQIWMKPQLKVLVKGKPEEQVLATCKNGSIAPSGPAAYSACLNVVLPTGPTNIYCSGSQLS
jgi:hypothetical protein